MNGYSLITRENGLGIIEDFTMCVKIFEKSKYVLPYACGTEMIRQRTETVQATSGSLAVRDREVGGRSGGIRQSGKW